MDSNILVVVADTARADELQAVTTERSDSPLSALANRGGRFRSVFSSAPWTLPAHASLFTGTYTARHATHAGAKRYDGRFDTLAELLSDHGYRTVGITNNAWVTDEFGLARGFDQFLKVWQYYQTDTDFGEIRLTARGIDQLRRAVSAGISGSVLRNLANAMYGRFLYRRRDYGARRTNRLAASWLDERDRTRPFFMFVNYLEPHLDYRPPESYARPFLPAGMSHAEARDIPQSQWEYVAGELELSERELAGLRGLYRGELAYLDDRIGDLLDTVRGATVERETVVVVLGDHGENIGEHGLMDHQYSLHETVLHVPLIVAGGPFDGLGTRDDLVQTLDLFSTLLDVAGVDSPHEHQGVSVHPSSSESRTHAFAEYLAPQPSIDRLSDETGIPESALDRFDQRIRAVRTDDHKLVRHERDGDRLYDVAGDDETTDVSDSRPEVTEELAETLDEWIRSVDDGRASDADEMSDRTRGRLERLGYLL